MTLPYESNIVRNKRRQVVARAVLYVFAPVIWIIPCLLLTLVIGVFFGWIAAPIAALFIAFSADRIARQRRAMRARNVLAYVAHAIQLNLPLDPFLAAAEASERGAARTQIATLRIALQSGLPVHLALESVIPDLPHGLTASLAAAEPIGQLQPALASLVEEQEPTDPSDDSRIPYQRFYPLTLLLAITSILIFTTTFVLPKFREIFKDFRVALPPLTQRVMALTSALTDSALLVYLVPLVVLAIIYIPMSYYFHRVFLPYWQFPARIGLSQALRWWVPILHGIERDRSMAASAEFLARASAAGVPLPRALERTLHLPTNPFFRTRLRTWSSFLASGRTPADAARAAGLPGLLVGLLAPGPGGGSGAGEDALPATFDFLARYYRQRFSRTEILLRAAVEPVIVLFLGALVLAFAVATIAPLATLLNKVMDAYPSGYL